MLNVGRVSVTKIFVTRDSEAKSRAWLHSGWASRAGLLSHMNIYINIYKDINARLTQRPVSYTHLTLPTILLV